MAEVLAAQAFDSPVEDTSETCQDAPRPWPAPWIFALLALVNGVFQSYLITPLPYHLRQMGYSVDRIGSIVALVLLPMTIYFVWSPFIDLWFRRRTWIVMLAGVSGAMLCGAVPLLDHHTKIATSLLFCGYGVSLMTNSGTGGLLALTQAKSNKARAAGWMQGGGLAATALGGAALLYCSKNLPMPVTCTLAGLMVFLPATIALTIHEPAPVPIAGAFSEHFAVMGREIRHSILSRKALPGLLLLVAPVGSGAAQSLFVAMAGDYHVGARGVMLLNGLLGGVLVMLGAFVVVLLPSEWDRRLGYAAAGGVCGLVGVCLACAPMTPTVYFVGIGCYLLTVGVCYSFFLGVVMQTMGVARKSASTRFTLLVSLGNLPVVYMTRLEGWGYSRFGAHGVPALDAAGNLLVATFAALWICFRLTQKHPLDEPRKRNYW